MLEHTHTHTWACGSLKVPLFFCFFFFFFFLWGDTHTHTHTHTQGKIRKKDTHLAQFLTPRSRDFSVSGWPSKPSRRKPSPAELVCPSSSRPSAVRPSAVGRRVASLRSIWAVVETPMAYDHGSLNKSL